MIKEPLPQLEAPSKSFCAEYSNTFKPWIPLPSPGVHEAKVYKSKVLKTKNGQRALFLVWMQAYKPSMETPWRVPQLITFGEPGSNQRDKAIEAVRQILWASGHDGADPMVLSDKNLLGLQLGLVISYARHWGPSKRPIPVVDGYRARI